MYGPKYDKVEQIWSSSPAGEWMTAKTWICVSLQLQAVGGEWREGIVPLYLWAANSINDLCSLMMHGWSWSDGHHLLHLLSAFPSSSDQFTDGGNRW